MVRFIHIVWSPATGPIDAYENPSMAFGHARSMLGVEVASIKVRTRLPSIVLDDLGHDFEEDDETPVGTIVIDVDDLDEVAR